MTLIITKRFIEKVYVLELGNMIKEHSYLSFIIMGLGIEFLGKCIDKELKTWNTKGRSKSDFENAIKKIPSLQKYKHYLKKYSLYSSFRCGMAHASAPGYSITLSSKSERHHLHEADHRLNLKVEDFYNDFKDACLHIINDDDFSVDDKINKPFLEVPGADFNSGTDAISGQTSSLHS